MKLFGILLLLSVSSASFAQQQLECKFNIKSNKTKKDLKELRQSTITRKIELTSGLEHKEEIKINRLIAYPGEKKTDKYLIRVFEEDKREQALSKDKDIPIVRMSSSESFELNVSHDGHKTQVRLHTSEGNSKLTFNGVGETSFQSLPAYSFFKYLKKGKENGMISPLYVACRLSVEEIIDGTEGKKEFTSIDEEKAIHEKYKANKQ